MAVNKKRILELGRVAVVLIVAASVANPSDAFWGKKDSKRKQRKEINGVAAETLERLFEENPSAKDLYDSAFGWAVFDARQTKLMLAGGGGTGVAVERQSEKRTYMKSASVGVGIGFGIQLYQVVFLFETAEVMENFVETGWEVGAGANGVAGEEGQNLQVTATDTDQISAGSNEKAAFADVIAVFQFTEKGYMLQADITGTKYWKHDELNKKRR